MKVQPEDISITRTPASIIIAIIIIYVAMYVRTLHSSRCRLPSSLLLTALPQSPLSEAVSSSSLFFCTHDSPLFRLIVRFLSRQNLLPSLLRIKAWSANLRSLKFLPFPVGRRERNADAAGIVLGSEVWVGEDAMGLLGIVPALLGLFADVSVV